MKGLSRVEVGQVVVCCMEGVTDQLPQCRFGVDDRGGKRGDEAELLFQMLH